MQKLKVINFAIFFLLFVSVFSMSFLAKGFQSKVYAAACPIADGGAGDADGVVNGVVKIQTNTTWTATAGDMGQYDCSSVTIWVANNGVNPTTLTLIPYNSGDTDYTNDSGVNISAASILIDDLSSIASDGAGYAGGSGGLNGYGPGRGLGSNVGAYGGAGYGGTGGPISGGGTYGSLTAPVDLGSGGGSRGDIGGAGGGAIKITTTGAMTVNGTISANGSNPNGWGGGGSGGSIFLNSSSFSGNGTIRANGVNGVASGGGGGGRIAMYYSSSNNFSGSISVAGGNGATSGTAFIEDSVNHDIKIPCANSNWYASDRASWNFRDITINNNVVFVPTNQTLLTISSSRTTTFASNITVTLWGSYSNDTNGVGVFLNLNGDVTIPANTTISAEGAGYGGGALPYGNGKGSGKGLGNAGGSGGGGYGGVGGNGVAGTGGPTYGSLTQPMDLGSGGGARDESSGAGGGAIKITTTGTMTVNGTISANGANSGGWGAGGSGGSVLLSSANYSGNGTVRANGGGGTASGSGGGGRIAMYYSSSNNFAGSISVAGGTGAASSPGTVGTAFVEDSVNHDIKIPCVNGNWFGSDRPSWNFRDITINNNITFVASNQTLFTISSSRTTTFASNITVTMWGNYSDDANGVGVFLNLKGDVTIPANTTISANGAGYAGGTLPYGNGKGPGKGLGNGGGSGGGGYGGVGGNGAVSGGGTYGSLTEPMDLGSGGGARDDSSGAGGGAIKISTTGTMTVNGVVSANGANSNGWGAGGSGGSVFLVARIMAGGGSATANGGSGTASGSGGGGRIAINYTFANNYTGATAANGATGPASNPGANGTVSVRLTNSTPDDPTSLGPTNVINGSYSSNVTPYFEFIISDPDASNTVAYQIQIATDSGFSSVVVDYTSALQTQGDASFTVGQAVGAGTYTGGSQMTLANSSYYWRVRTKDDSGIYSNYSLANSGEIAFNVDLVGPTAPSELTINTPSGTNQPTWSWTASTDDPGSGLGNPAYVIQYSPDSTFTVIGTIATSNTTNFTPASALSDRRWYVRVRSVDAVGNPSGFTSTGFVDIDTSAPISSDNTDNNWHQSSVSITLSCSDGMTSCAHTYYTTDGSNPTVASSQVMPIVLSADGVYTIKYFSVDAVGNIESVKTSTNQVKIDGTSPTVPGSLSTVTPSNSNHPVWTWNISSDETSGLANPTYTIQWSLDSNFGSGVSSATTNVASYSVSANLTDGTWFFRARSSDVAGNNSAYTANSSFLVDTTPPVLSVVTAVLTPDNDPTPNFTFSSTEVGAVAYQGSCLGNVSNAAVGSNIVTFDALIDGSYSNCKITVTDSVGNPSLQLTVPTFVIDTVAPSANVTNLVMKKVSGNVNVDREAWVNSVPVKFEWTPVSDNAGGSGIKGYCVNVSDTQGALPEASKGLLGTTQVDIANTPCSFIAPATITNGVATLDLSDVASHGNPWLTSSLFLYYMNIKPIDNAGNVSSIDPEWFQFHYDDTAPVNVKYISAPGGNFVNVADMNFMWPVGTALSASDSEAGLLGYQYQVNAIDDNGWKGADGNPSDPYLGIGYIPSTDSIYNLTVDQDSGWIALGDNTVYFRSIDLAGNYSSPSTYRTANISYGGEAPAFDVGASVTITPNISTENKFSISWPIATSASGNQIAGYYYMINTTPPTNVTTLEGNASAYIPAGTNTSVSNVVLKNVNKGSNSVIVVAVDDHGNYSPGNKISGSFTLNSTNPDPVVGLFAADASVKEASLWRASLAWVEPAYKGTGTLTYIIQRSENGSTWTEISRTTGLSYVDTVAESKKYYWRVGTIDTSDTSIANPSFTNGVFVIPRGKYASPAALVTGPTVTDVSTKKATINWSTERNSDSRVLYGLETGKYFDVEASISTQLTAHSVKLINLLPGTSYFYKVLWTDEDGNIGESDEKLFQTAPQPVATNVKESEIGLYSALTSFTVKGATSVVIDYGKSTGYGQQATVNTAINESDYTLRLSNLEDGSVYHYRITLFDNEGGSYKMEDHIFSTLPRPRISNVKMQQARNTASATVLVSWSTNVETTSIISYYKDGNSTQPLEGVDTKFIVNEHKMTLTNLAQDSVYVMQIKVRDHMGNEAISDPQRFTTAVDTRPPSITNLAAEGESNNVLGSDGQSAVQLVVSWSTDEPATSQVEFAEGAGSVYSNKTFEDSTLASEHIVILPNLQPSKVYHLRVISKDRAGNETVSYDVVSVTPKAGQNALDLIFGSLKNVFTF